MTKEILVAFSLGESRPLGNIWRITAKKTDFYLDPLGQNDAFHLSVHGSSARYPDGHRFHVKVDRRAVTTVKARGDFILYDLPRAGRAFDGQELAPGVFRVARVRWLWDLQRPRFHRAAVLPGPLPNISDNRSGARLSGELKPNEAADLDLVVSYGQPYWPGEQRSQRDNARLGPLRNDAGMWLTATSFQRSQTVYPAPDGVVLPRPSFGEEPNRIMGGAPGQDASGDMYWFVHAITSREVIEAAQVDATG